MMKKCLLIICLAVQVIAIAREDIDKHNGGDEKNPAKVAYSYSITNDARKIHGHHVLGTRDNVRGNFYVNLPHGHSHVDYLADAFGYHPIVRYTPKGTNNLMSQHFGIHTANLSTEPPSQLPIQHPGNLGIVGIVAPPQFNHPDRQQVPDDIPRTILFPIAAPYPNYIPPVDVDFVNINPGVTYQVDTREQTEEEGIQKLVESTQNLVSNQDVLSINEAAENLSATNATEVEQKDTEDAEGSEKHFQTIRGDQGPFIEPIVVDEENDVAPQEIPDQEPKEVRIVPTREYLPQQDAEVTPKSINVQILDDHNNGQFLKETTYTTSTTPITDSRQLLRRLKGNRGPDVITTTTTRITSGGSVSDKVLAPIQAGLRLSNSEEDCDEPKTSKKPEYTTQKTIVEVQKSVNVKNIVITEEKKLTTERPIFGVRTKCRSGNCNPPVIAPKIIEKPTIIEKPVHITKYIDRPYPVEKPVVVERIVPTPVPYPVTVEKKVEVPKIIEKHIPKIVEKPVHITKYIDRPYPVEKPVVVERIVPTPIPYPVTVEKKVEVPRIIEKPVPVEKKVHITKYIDRPYTEIVHVPVEKIVEKQIKVPYPVEKIVEKPIHVPYPVEKVVEKIVDRPVEVQVPVAVEKVVEKVVDRPVAVEVEKLVDRPYPIEKIVHVPVHIPYQVPVQVQVPVPVQVPVAVAVEKPVPYPYAVPVGIPVPKHIHHKHHSVVPIVHYKGKPYFFKTPQIKHVHLESLPVKLQSYPLTATSTVLHPIAQTNVVKHIHLNSPSAVNVHADASFSSIYGHPPQKLKPIYGIPDFLNHHDTQTTQFNVKINDPAFEGYAGHFGYHSGLGVDSSAHASYSTGVIFKDDYLGPLPLKTDYWNYSPNLPHFKYRRNLDFLKNIRLEYGFKPPLVPSPEIDELGNPINRDAKDC